MPPYRALPAPPCHAVSLPAPKAPPTPPVLLPPCLAAASAGPTSLEIVSAAIPNAADGIQLRWDEPPLERSYTLRLQQVNGASQPTYADRAIAWTDVEVANSKAAYTVTGLAAGRWAG